MRTRTIIGLGCLAAIAGAAYKDDLAAVYVALGVGSIIYLLHAIEIKLNRLLDHYGIFVSDQEAARD